MEEKLSDALDNLLGLLLLEGSYGIEEEAESFSVTIETKDAGRLIGFRGESLEALQLIVNQIASRKIKEGENFKRVIVDVESWRKQKEDELSKRAQEWGKQVQESGQDMELEPQSPWQRRIIHMVISEIDGLESESIGEGRDRHIVIKLKNQKSKTKTKTKDKQDKDVKTEES